LIPFAQDAVFGIMQGLHALRGWLEPSRPACRVTNSLEPKSRRTRGHHGPSAAE
jgi:hypothetical protein